MQTATRRTSRLAHSVTALLATIVAVTAVATVVVDVHVAELAGAAPLEPGWTAVLAGLAMAVPGFLLAARLPWHPIAMVLVGFGAFWVVDGLATALVNLAWLEQREAWWGVLAFWIYARVGSVLILSVPLLLLLFPDGRLPLGAWRPIAVAAIGLGLVMPIAFMLAPASALGADDAARVPLIEAFDRAPTLPLPDAVWAVVLAAAPVCLAVSLITALAVVIGRRRGADPVRRAQLRWLAWAGALFILGIIVQLVFPHPLFELILPITIGLIGAAVVVAVTRHRLYEIDRLLSWTIVYGILIAAIVLVDALIVVAVGSAFDDRIAMLAAVIAVTLVYVPVRDRLLSFAIRVVSGRRGDPYAVVSRLVSRLERSGDRESRLQDLAEAIADTFASRSVRVELGPQQQPTAVVQLGERTSGASGFPIEYGGRELGRIELDAGRRPVASTRDQRLLGDLVRLSAVAIQATEAGEQLRASRERLVIAREDERSRLRRDLHDGLGPLLAGVTLRLEASSNTIARDPDRARVILDDAIEQQRGVIDEIRRIVHDLRPPALDDLGLARAILQLADRLDGGGQRVRAACRVDVDLPPAVEVAAYRIVAEALTNARRHSGASEVQVDVTADGEHLDIEIADDGRGMRSDAVPGVGVRSMRERAEEVGGSLELLSDATGTRVLARLPYRPESEPPTGAITDEEHPHAR